MCGECACHDQAACQASRCQWFTWGVVFLDCCDVSSVGKPIQQWFEEKVVEKIDQRYTLVRAADGFQTLKRLVHAIQSRNIGQLAVFVDNIDCLTETSQEQLRQSFEVLFESEHIKVHIRGWS